MKKRLARIEMVMVLQRVELLKFCTAEEVVRIAAIAQERGFAGGEQIYRANDPADTLYCLVEGRVRLEGADGEVTQIEPPGTFGVREILSGRLRARDAAAEIDTLTLAVAAEDFFDLLSNNIEIVKALFRELLDVGEGRRVLT
jgi:CRP-like cAMP-binding protein